MRTDSQNPYPTWEKDPERFAPGTHVVVTRGRRKGVGVVAGWVNGGRRAVKFAEASGVVVKVGSLREATPEEVKQYEDG